MNKIAALVISTILLTQIASYSYGDIPSKIEWEEPLKGDPDWKVSGRNSSLPCGGWHDTHITTTTNSFYYNHSDSPKLEFAITCATVGTNYTIAYKVYESNSSTAYYLSGVVNQTVVANSINFTFTVNLGVMNSGFYSVNTSLSNTTYDSSSSLTEYNGSSHNSTHFYVMMQPTPGIDVGVFPSHYSSNSTVSISIQSYNLNSSSNVYYLIQWEIKHWLNATLLSINGTPQVGSYNVTGSYDVTSLSVAPPDGDYAVIANITEVVTIGGNTWFNYTDADYSLFTVGYSTNNTGNQTGNNTTTPQITIKMDQSWYQSSSTAIAYINSTDLTINKQYRVDWELEQQSPTTSIVDNGNFTWTATSTTDHTVVYLTLQMDLTGL